MEYTEKVSQYLKKLSIWNRTTAEIRLTKTMLDKCIIDANTSVRTLAMLYGVNYDDMKNGEKIEVLRDVDESPRLPKGIILAGTVLGALVVRRAGMPHATAA